MSWGSKTTQTQQQTQNQAYNNSTTPTEDPWVTQLRQSFGPYVSNIMAQASKPVYGDAQTASYMQNLNSIADNATKTLNSNLAGHGISNSGAYASGATSIQNNKLGQLSGFFSQLPFLQQQAMQQNQLQALGAGFNLTGRAPQGQISSGVSNGSSDSTSVTKTDPGIAGLVSSLAGIGMGMATGGLSSMAGGGSFLGGMMGGGGSYGGSPGGGFGNINMSQGPPPNPFYTSGGQYQMPSNPFMTGWNPNG